MDHYLFDTFVATLSAPRSRRRTLAVAGAALLALRAALAPAASARRKKKCPKKQTCGKTCCKKGTKCLSGVCGVPCTFTINGLIMSFNGNCVLTKDVTIPQGIVLDGNNRTITLAGKRNDPPALLITEGASEVQNVTIDARPLTGKCGAIEGALIQVTNSTAVVDSVTMRGLRCAVGINASSRGAPTDPLLTISGTTIEGSGKVAIRLQGDAQDENGNLLFASIQDSAIRGVGRKRFLTGVAAMAMTDVTVTNSAITSSEVGIFAKQDSAITAEDSAITGAKVGISMGDVVGPRPRPGATLIASRNVIVGPGAPSIAGITVLSIANASIQQNQISNYFNTPGDEPACGILYEPTTTLMNVVANTFPAPGNQQNICPPL